MASRRLIRRTRPPRARRLLVKIIRAFQRSKRLRIIVIGSAVAVIAAVVLVVVLTNASDLAKQASNIDPVPTYSIPTGPASTPVPTTTPVVTPDPTLKKDDENEQVQVLQERLMDLGYLDLDESTQKFGPATELAVKWFQRQQNLPQTGIADAQTLSWIYSNDAQKYTLLEKTSGSDVDSLQLALKNLGYLSKVTGYYGSETVKAVEKFQKRNNLSVDGKTGEKTLDVIYSPKAKPDPSVAALIRSKANIDKMIKTAQEQLGDPYIGGHEGPNSFDCSGLVYYCLHVAGSNRNRFNAQGYSEVNDWEKITSISKLKKGDLMFFWSGSKGKIGHVSIYIGGGMMIDASSSNGKVVKRSATSSWCRSEFKLGRRPW